MPARLPMPACLPVPALAAQQRGQPEAGQVPEDTLGGAAPFARPAGGQLPAELRARR